MFASLKEKVRQFGTNFCGNDTLNLYRTQDIPYECVGVLRQKDIVKKLVESKTVVILP